MRRSRHPCPRRSGSHPTPPRHRTPRAALLLSLPLLLSTARDLATQDPVPAPPPPRADTAVARIAFPDELVFVERSRDRAGRDRLVARMHGTRVDVTSPAISARELATRLALALDGAWNFVVLARAPVDAAWPAIELDLRGVTVASLVGVVQGASDLRFVYRDGVVLLKPAAELDEVKVLRTYSLRHAVAPLRDRPGPELGLGGERVVVPEPEDTGKTLSGWTIERLQDLVRQHADPESWDLPGVSMSESNGTLLIRQTERVHRRIEVLFGVLGVWSPAEASRVVRRARRG